MDREKFLAACRDIQAEHERKGIGTYSEQSLHAIIKKYFEQDSDRHEVKIGRYIADIVGENGIIEVQTRHLFKLKNKLSAFLEYCRVTVVFPIAETKYLYWRDTETGELTNRRKSPRKGTVYDAFYELCGIKQFLKDPNFTFCVILFDIEEYKDLDGWSHDKKKGAHRYERRPIDIKDEIYLNSPYDYLALLPDTVPEEFTSADIAKHCKIRVESARYLINTLTEVGAIECFGKKDRYNIYRKIL